MKKLVLFFAAAVAVSFASCGGQTAQNDAEEVEEAIEVVVNDEDATEAEVEAVVVDEAVEAPAAE